VRKNAKDIQTYRKSERENETGFIV